MGSSVFCQTFARHNGLPVRPREIAYRATHVLTVIYPMLVSCCTLMRAMMYIRNSWGSILYCSSRTFVYQQCSNFFQRDYFVLHEALSGLLRECLLRITSFLPVWVSYIAIPPMGTIFYSCPLRECPLPIILLWDSLNYIAEPLGDCALPYLLKEGFTVIRKTF